jgi:putative ABC transport system permease protein
MNSLGFIIKSFSYYKKQHFGVFLASLISTAILTGALIIGDSVKLSLKSVVDNRLGNIHQVLTSHNRFFKNDLSTSISDELSIPTASVLHLDGVVINPENSTKVNNVQFIGVNNNFSTTSGLYIPEISDNEVAISKNISLLLNLKIGDELLIKVNKEGLTPLNAPFTNNNDQLVSLRVMVTYITNEKGAGSFSLLNNQSPPHNIFLNKEYLSYKVDLAGYSNMIIISGINNVNSTKLNQSLKGLMSLADYNLQLNQLANSAYFQLISDRVFIDKSLTEKITNINISENGVLTYFANSIEYGGHETPYSFVSAISNDILNERISNNEIIINSWLANDLNALVGDTINIRYYIIGQLGDLIEDKMSFIVKKILPITNNELQKSLMPDFPGLSDAGNCSDWEAGIPIDLEKIRKKDEEYWDDYNGTPKAFISLDLGMELWENKFGQYTSLLIDTSDISYADLEAVILKYISPTDVGLSFNNVRTVGNYAAENGVDFGELFLSLSFFIIVSSILLTVLVFSLSIKKREYETGVLKSLGFNRKKIIILRFTEVLPSIIVASLIGSICGIGYNNLMLFGLNTIWNDAIHTNLITVYILPSTIITGIAVGLISSLLSVYITTIRMLKADGVNIIRSSSSSKGRSLSYITKGISGTCISVSIIITTYFILSSKYENPSMLLFAGFLFLSGCITMVGILMKPSNKLRKNLVINMFKLAVTNTKRNRNRNLAVISLLALGTFTIIVTGANRLTFSEAENQRNSGTGGFQLWIENSIPLIKDINTEIGKEFYSLADEEELDSVFFMQLSKLTGDDASCLNLNQVKQPALIGVNPYLLDSLRAFTFSNLLNDTENPWLDLTKYLDNNTIPAIADQTVIQWGLMKKIGDTLIYRNENGKDLNLILIGGLAPSVFQGNILIFDSLLFDNYPGLSGTRIILAETHENNTDNVSGLLYNYLEDHGVHITTTSERLINFYSVTNTYLSIFMLLGGFGVIIGTIGLSLVLVRNMIERKNEVAIYYALGFKKSQIFRLVFIENLFLLITGITIGIISAFIGILPSIMSESFNISDNFIIVLLSMVIISGLFWIYIPAKAILSKNLLNNLRTE